VFERYNEAARRALFYTRYETSQLGGRVIETEHLLLGLIHDRRAPVRSVLERAGVSLDDVRDQVERRTAGGERVSTSIEIPFSDDVQRVLRFAMEEADDLESNDIGPEHLLLGILREDESLGAVILRDLGLEFARARQYLPPPASADRQA
jgi:ATP-dependent Clp protease ATP-binding subunit ClpC